MTHKYGLTYIVLFILALQVSAMHHPSNRPGIPGQHIQRTMGLLAESTPENRNEVTIFFYGQSIIGSRWHKYVERELRQRYPHADLTVRNWALGGFASQYLVRMVEKDVLLAKPDLVIFHVLGSQIEYERIIHTIRQRTATEVMIMTSHWRRESLQPDGSYELDDWDTFFDKFLPAVAKEYDCELVDVRWPWKAFLEKSGLEPGVLLTDSVHLNEQGKELMAEIALNSMVHIPALKTDLSEELVTTLSIGREGDVQWQDGVLEFEFEGSRVDIMNHGGGGSSCEVYIDGKKPSELASSYLHSRATGISFPLIWPEIMYIGFETMPVPQVWSLTLDSIDPETFEVAFSLSGSVTGPDGSGKSTERFVSDSGQVVIDPRDWVVARKLENFEYASYEPGMQVQWKTVKLGDDLLFPKFQLEDDRMLSHTIVDGLDNKKHTLMLVSKGNPPPLSQIRIYKPMIPAGEFEHMGIGPSDFDYEQFKHFLAPTPEE